ncbi:MAG: glycosyltransferase family 4 protein [Bacteroidetes bacterium]|nr:glycosyltransferase family 4 protein [Bacteroidota bacterium]MBU1718804.1 glycosyltransferase family 4 protein [Bacteroidota bacterium]
MKEILFVASHRIDRAPGQRFRFEQYFQYLEKNGFKCTLSNIVSADDDQYLYKPGELFRKAEFVRKSHSIRRKNIRELGKYDIIFIFREALMSRSIRYEKQFKASGKPIVFDFDDSIWLSNVSDANKWFSWMKNAEKTASIVALSDVAIAGNQYLADFAKKYNQSVIIIPTTIDTEDYKPLPKIYENNSVTIGWSGSITTIQHFEYAVPFLKKIKEKYGDSVQIGVIGDGNYNNPEIGVQGIPWSHSTEIKDLSEFDIGIMPLPDDEWAKGKCGLKGLQYMALEIPTIMSPVGVNTEIIQDGENGFLANSENEWFEKICLLIENSELRQKLGKAGRQTVIERYSVESQKERYLKLFNDLLRS